MKYTIAKTIVTRSSAMLLVLAALLMAACAAENGDVGMAMTQVKLTASADSQQLNVELADAAGTPITDASVSLEGNMNHAGMAPMISNAVADDADGTADGVYHVPFQFSMNGDWIITVSVKLADGTTETHDIDLTVTGDGVDIKQEDRAATMDMAMDMSQDEMVQDAEQGPVHVTDAWVRASLPMTDNTALYFTLHNNSDTPIRLANVLVDGLMADMHESIVENNVVHMEPRPDGFEIPAGEHLMLAEGGKHVMLMGVTEPLTAGNEIEVTLEFDGAEPITFMAPIADEAVPAMDHSQHGG